MAHYLSGRVLFLNKHSGIKSLLQVASIVFLPARICTTLEACHQTSNSFMTQCNVTSLEDKRSLEQNQNS